MLQYDLTTTRMFRQHHPSLLTDAEMFAITAALLLLHDMAYRDLQQQDIELAGPDVEHVAQCIEYRLPTFTRDIGSGIELRDRLADFVGLRIGCVSACETNDCQRPK